MLLKSLGWDWYFKFNFYWIFFHHYEQNCHMFTNMEFIFHLHIFNPELASNEKYQVKLLTQSWQICQNKVEDENLCWFEELGKWAEVRNGGLLGSQILSLIHFIYFTAFFTLWIYSSKWKNMNFDNLVVLLQRIEQSLPALRLSYKNLCIGCWFNWRSVLRLVMGESCVESNLFELHPQHRALTISVNCWPILSSS